MGKLSVRRHREEIYSPGDMRFTAEFFSRSIAAPGFNSTKFGQDHILIGPRRCAIRGATNNKTFSGVSLDDGATHVFACRYDANFEQADIVKHDSLTYKILEIRRVSERRRFLEFRCKLLGESDKGANR